MAELRKGNPLPVKSGWWLYDGTVRCRVEVLPRDVWPGDYRLGNGEEVVDERDIPCFELHYQGPSGEFSDYGPHFATLDQAIAGAARLFGSCLVWDEPTGTLV
jgi:hypothetical protein